MGSQHVFIEKKKSFNYPRYLHLSGALMYLIHLVIGWEFIPQKLLQLLDFSGYKTEFFSFQNIPENLDPSYKEDLDLWNCLGRAKLVLQQNFKGLI